jgi:hypothetical protein
VSLIWVKQWFLTNVHVGAARAATSAAVSSWTHAGSSAVSGASAATVLPSSRVAAYVSNVVSTGAIRIPVASLTARSSPALWPASA